MTYKKIIAATFLAFIMPHSAVTESFNATVVAGHPGVFRWVKMIDEAFVPSVNSTLAGSQHSFTFSGQYGGAIAKVGDELETVEA